MRTTRDRAGRLLSAGVVLAGMLLVASTATVAADGATVTRGDLHAFAGGIGLDLSGRAQMVRTADGRTIVAVHVQGLAPNTTYAAHVHQLPCGTNDADGHYKFDPAGAPVPPNEIWPGFTTNDDGVGNGRAVVDGTAGATAVSVVIHAPGGTKIACADLQ